MSDLMQHVVRKAQDLCVPLSAHLDVTYRCNERCIHCYLTHEDRGELSTVEVRGLLEQMAEAGVLFLLVSGGELFVRDDALEILEHARRLAFNVKLKTNGTLIEEREAAELARIGVNEVQVSIYSAIPEVHDAITKLAGSLARSIRAVRLLRSRGIQVMVSNVLMRKNARDYGGVKALATELDARFAIDPTITPHLDGARLLSPLNLVDVQLKDVFLDERAVGDVAQFCAPPPAVDDSVLDGIPCSAGYTSCYVSPYGEVYPCVQFPLACGNVRRQRFADIWRQSAQMRKVRSIRARDLTVCHDCVHLASCTRCPGLAFMEGDLRGPSREDCRKSLLRTGILPAASAPGADRPQPRR